MNKLEKHDRLNILDLTQYPHGIDTDQRKKKRLHFQLQIAFQAIFSSQAGTGPYICDREARRDGTFYPAHHYIPLLTQKKITNEIGEVQPDFQSQFISIDRFLCDKRPTKTLFNSIVETSALIQWTLSDYVLGDMATPRLEVVNHQVQQPCLQYRVNNQGTNYLILTPLHMMASLETFLRSSLQRDVKEANGKIETTIPLEIVIKDLIFQLVPPPTKKMEGVSLSTKHMDLLKLDLAKMTDIGLQVLSSHNPAFCYLGYYLLVLSQMMKPSKMDCFPIFENLPLTLEILPKENRLPFLSCIVFLINKGTNCRRIHSKHLIALDNSIRNDESQIQMMGALIQDILSLELPSDLKKCAIQLWEKITPLVTSLNFKNSQICLSRILDITFDKEPHLAITLFHDFQNRRPFPGIKGFKYFNRICHQLRTFSLSFDRLLLNNIAVRLIERAEIDHLQKILIELNDLSSHLNWLLDQLILEKQTEESKKFLVLCAKHSLLGRDSSIYFNHYLHLCQHLMQQDPRLSSIVQCWQELNTVFPYCLTTIPGDSIDLVLDIAELLYQEKHSPNLRIADQFIKALASLKLGAPQKTRFQSLKQQQIDDMLSKGVTKAALEEISKSNFTYTGPLVFQALASLAREEKTEKGVKAFHSILRLAQMASSKEEHKEVETLIFNLINQLCSSEKPNIQNPDELKNMQRLLLSSELHKIWENNPEAKCKLQNLLWNKLAATLFNQRQFEASAKVLLDHPEEFAISEIPSSWGIKIDSLIQCLLKMHLEEAKRAHNGEFGVLAHKLLIRYPLQSPKLWKSVLEISFNSKIEMKKSIYQAWRKSERLELFKPYPQERVELFILILKLLSSTQSPDLIDLFQDSHLNEGIFKISQEIELTPQIKEHLFTECIKGVKSVKNDEQQLSIVRTIIEKFNQMRLPSMQANQGNPQNWLTLLNLCVKTNEETLLLYACSLFEALMLNPLAPHFGSHFSKSFADLIRQFMTISNKASEQLKNKFRDDLRLVIKVNLKDFNYFICAHAFIKYEMTSGFQEEAASFIKEGLTQLTTLSHQQIQDMKSLSSMVREQLGCLITEGDPALNPLIEKCLRMKHLKSLLSKNEANDLKIRYFQNKLKTVFYLTDKKERFCQMNEAFELFIQINPQAYELKRDKDDTMMIGLIEQYYFESYATEDPFCPHSAVLLNHAYQAKVFEKNRASYLKLHLFLTLQFPYETLLKKDFDAQVVWIVELFKIMEEKHLPCLIPTVIKIMNSNKAVISQSSPAAINRLFSTILQKWGQDPFQKPQGDSQIFTLDSLIDTFFACGNEILGMKGKANDGVPRELCSLFLNEIYTVCCRNLRGDNPQIFEQLALMKLGCGLLLKSYGQGIFDQCPSRLLDHTEHLLPILLELELLNDLIDPSQIVSFMLCDLYPNNLSDREKLRIVFSLLKLLLHSTRHPDIIFIFDITIVNDFFEEGWEDRDDIIELVEGKIVEIKEILEAGS